jgi:putative phosphoribosyl transferase
MLFLNRTDAGTRLGAHLIGFGLRDPVVLALPRGGVVVGFEVARALSAPLDIIVVRKLGVPFQPELAMGAIGEDGVLVIDDEVVEAAGLSTEELTRVEARERLELERRIGRLRADQHRLPLTGHTAVVVDDGVATGSTARAACQVARAHGAARVVLAVPVGARSSIEQLRLVADDVVCLESPDSFFAVGQWYQQFSQVSDAEVTALLARARLEALPDPLGPIQPPSRNGVAGTAEVMVEAADVRLPGELALPAAARGVVVFAHGSGSSRHSPRNQFVAAMLQRAGVGTLLFDLLTEREEHQRSNVFDIELLAGRLAQATHWLHRQPAARNIGIGYFGASTGAAAALWAAAEPDVHVDAVVSRGGRPDLAMARLPSVRAPTLLIVGGHDGRVLEMNRVAQNYLHSECTVAVVPGATHLFEEPGALAAVAGLAADWFVAHLTPAARRAG